MGQADIQTNLQNKFIIRMRTHEQNKLETLLSMNYEPDEAEAIYNALTDFRVDNEEFTELINNIKNNWRY